MNTKTKKKKIKKPTLSVVNAGHPDRVSVLSTKCGGCHPKGLIVASSHEIKQILIIIFYMPKPILPFAREEQKLTETLVLPTSST